MTTADVVVVIFAALGGAALVTMALPYIARRDSVPPVPRRAMRQLLERVVPSDEDGTP